MKHALLILCVLSLCSCGTFRKAGTARQSVALPSVYSSDIDERERAIVYAGSAPTNITEIAAILLLGDIKQDGLAITKREIEYDELNRTIRATIEVDTATWFSGVIRDITSSITTVGDWIASAASGAAGTFRSTPRSVTPPVDETPCQ